MYSFTRSIRVAAATLGLALLGTAVVANATVETSAAPVVAPQAVAQVVSTDTVVALDATVDNTFERELLVELNKARATKHKCGRTMYKPAKPVKINGKLNQAAENHSADMSVKDYFAHASDDGKTSPFTRIKATGYRYRAAGETLAAGYNTPKSVVAAWLASPSHCKVIMGKAYTQVGLGYYAGDGKYRYYTTADFGKPA